jgi:hypothetical protein
MQRVAVTLATSPGRSESLVLEAASAVTFEAAVSTRLPTGASVPGALDLAGGEVVTVAYRTASGDLLTASRPVGIVGWKSRP